MTDGDSAGKLLRVMMLGEIYGKPGRKAIASFLPRLRQEQRLDLVIANGESAAGGFALTISTAEELLKSGIDVITSGSRVFDQREMLEWLKTSSPASVLRPLNYPPGTPGHGSIIKETGKGPVEVLNLNGRIYFNEMDSPFRVIDKWLANRVSSRPLVLDFHAEATSEKVVMGWYLDGRVSAVLGTHTRTPTADARLLHYGTAHVTDVGIIGPFDSAAGTEVEVALKPFTSHIYSRPKTSQKFSGPVVFNSVIVEIEPASAKAVNINRFDLMLEDESM